MARKSKQHDKQFKLDALKYIQEHPDLTQEECCKNLGIGRPSPEGTSRCAGRARRAKKSHRHSGKRLTAAIYVEVAAKVEASKVTKRRVSVSGMLKFLGVSRSGYPYDNACIESFHSLIKREWLDRFKIRDFNHAYGLVFEYVEAFYNTVRIHSHCKYMSPEQFKKLFSHLAA